MHKKPVFTIIIIIFILCTSCSTNTNNMEVVSSNIFNDATCTTLNLTIILNSRTCSDYTACANEIIQHCIDNSFENIFFSYDKGYPNSLTADIYLSTKDLKNGNVLFRIDYVPENVNKNYNIYDNNEKYILKIKKSND